MHWFRRDISSVNGDEKRDPSLYDQGDSDPNLLIPDRKLGKGYDDYFNGDIYEQSPCKHVQDWETPETTKSTMPYLMHIKSLSMGWPHLRYLAEWMDVTTSPTKWQLIKGMDNLKEIRAERASRTKIMAIDFISGQSAPAMQQIDDPNGLKTCLDDPAVPDATRLYVVEDLSRDVIELLGSKLDIDPLFFREHINDYTWYNTRDPWVELPDLDIVSRSRSYFRLMYMQPRYFTSRKSYEDALKQAGRFNVLRRLDEDNEHESLFDDKSATVALVRCKASLWIRRSSNTQQAIGVLLIDPSITEGFPLWRGYRPFRNSPTPSNKTPFEVPPRTGLFEDLIFWIRQTSQKDIDAIEHNPNAMAFRILEIICAEWLTLSRYITARLGQIEWEIESPERFQVRKLDLQESMNFNTSLKKLHTWRRRLPIYKAMVADTHTKIFPSHESGSGRRDCIADLKKDYEIVAAHIDNLLSRTERIAAVATAVTAIEESRRAIEQNKTLGRLTYLAVIFAPLSFVSSFFSMSTDLSGLTQTIWVYFCVAVPISFFVYLLVDKNWTNNMQSAYNKTKEVKHNARIHERKH
ncbi:uncharacterized protein GGS22DRAFT_131273 [Annulohypoxylon maeteangense]|uniref:uncharacterized protein n=1 Tax=Annulohypoxylon maeteangense TaxID=1927788 RepID=UPI0020084A92|nr:uncharacterized protein GGS22DRAFT_131273 [Annulohypoxylon maeteangense]KAI0885613.1 hypothetical protein GGS22DRAFT_131273 [Annulohypoxylon maeteangense]